VVHRYLPASLFLLLLPISCAQMLRTGSLKLRVVTAEDRKPCVQAHVQLSGSEGPNSRMESYTDRDGMVEFQGIPQGTYRAMISGVGIESSTSQVIEIDALRSVQSIDVEVRRSSGGSRPAGVAGDASVAAADLKIPESAARRFDKAMSLIAKEDWHKAIEQLHKALEIYPNYPAAYTNLGVIYARLGDNDGEREALLKAVALNPHFAPALLCLGQVAIRGKNYPEAESWLTRANAADPTHAQTLVLLANMQLLNQHYDEAIASCRRVHAGGRPPHAAAHYVAARALESQNHPLDAVSELKIFLEEEPSGSRADSARKEMSGLEAQITASAR
jgi:tetratricopeptide (TPR) repeat protein